MSLQENHFPGHHNVSRLNAVNVNTAGKVFRLPREAMPTSRYVTREQHSSLSPFHVENLERNML